MDAPQLPPHLSDKPPVAEDALAEWIDWCMTQAVTTGTTVDAVATEVFSDLPDFSDRAAEVWRVSDTSGAEWAMARLAEAEEQVAAVIEQAKAWQNRIIEWLEVELRRPEATAAYFRGQLEDYLRRLRASDEKIKSVKLPSGTIKSTKVAATVSVVDRDALVAWVKEGHPEILKLDVNISDVKPLIKLAEDQPLDLDTGQIVPGVAVVPERVSIKAVPK